MDTPEDNISKAYNLNIIKNLNVNVLQEICHALFTEENIEFKAIADENNCDKAVLKDAYINILGLITEAAKNNYSVEKFTAELNDTLISKSHVKILCEKYKFHKKLIRGNLQVIGNSQPHIVDVKWKLEYCIKDNAAEFRDLRYIIHLSVIKNNKLSTIQFVCNILQLQELVFKLKDIMHHLEKLSLC